MLTLLIVYTLLFQDFPDTARLKVQPGLPDPLTAIDGTKIATKLDWERQRKPELKALIQHYMYGQMPPLPKDMKSEVLFENKNAFGGKATLKEVALTVGPAGIRRFTSCSRCPIATRGRPRYLSASIFMATTP